MVLGSAKTVTPEEARDRASGILAEVRLGGDPATARTESRAAETVLELFEAFMDSHVRTKRKARTAKLFDGYIRNHIKPAIGTKKAPTLPRADVERLHNAIGKTNPVTANRVLALIGAGYSYGLCKALLPKQTVNPAKGIEKFPEETRERFLSDVEMARLGDAIRLAETTGIPWESQPEESKHVPKNQKTGCPSSGRTLLQRSAC